MKQKQLKPYIGEVITYRTVWNNFITAKLIEVNGYFATFEKDDYQYHIKIFNIAQVQKE